MPAIGVAFIARCPISNLGTAPPVDLVLLEKELRGFLDELIERRFHADSGSGRARRINDIALSGNGEPTSAAEFSQVIELIGKLKRELALPEHIKLLLITNGSLLQRENVQQGLRQMAQLNGEVWFKLDRAASREWHVSMILAAVWKSA
jgi:wyosine [tRNA(Phe)-imidazoG37] synthetase (radical SAM superfamily)